MKYWNNQGDARIEEAWQLWVPTGGESPHPWGELIRTIGRINYEVFNNGGCNLDDRYKTGLSGSHYDCAGSIPEDASEDVREAAELLARVVEDAILDNLPDPNCTCEGCEYGYGECYELDDESGYFSDGTCRNIGRLVDMTLDAIAEDPAFQAALEEARAST